MGDANRTMHARDTVAARLATCFITIDGNRFVLMQAKDLTATFTKNKREVGILGRTGIGHKTTSWNGTGSMTWYNNTDKFNELLLEYKRTGKDIYFDIQLTNEDPTSSVGKHTCILKDVNLDSGILAAFDADGEVLEHDCDFTFEDFEIPEKFVNVEGME